jgi:hypothetical protein
MGAIAGLAAGALIGGGLSAAGAAMKTKVKAPEAPKVNAGEQAGKAIAANIENLPQAQTLAQQVNKFSQEQLMSALKEFSPYAQETAKAQSKNIYEQAQGKIPKDVADQIYRSTAARSLMGGTGGSQFAGNLTARDLGLTSLQLMNQSIAANNAYLSGVRQNLMAPSFDVTSMFISPSQQISVQQWNETNRFNRDYLASQLRASQSAATAFGNSLQQMGTGLTGASMDLMGGQMNKMMTPTPQTSSMMNYQVPNMNYSQQYGVSYDLKPSGNTGGGGIGLSYGGG